MRTVHIDTTRLSGTILTQHSPYLHSKTARMHLTRPRSCTNGDEPMLQKWSRYGEWYSNKVAHDHDKQPANINGWGWGGTFPLTSPCVSVHCPLSTHLETVEAIQHKFRVDATTGVETFGEKAKVSKRNKPSNQHQWLPPALRARLCTIRPNPVREVVTEPAAEQQPTPATCRAVRPNTQICPLARLGAVTRASATSSVPVGSTRCTTSFLVLTDDWDPLCTVVTERFGVEVVVTLVEESLFAKLHQTR